MVSPALAEVTPAVPEEYHGGMKTTEKYHNRQIPLSAGKSQVELPAETLFPDYYSTDLFFNGGEFDFKVKGFKEEPRLARQKSYSSIHKKKKEGLSQRGRIKLDTKYFKGLFSDTGYALTSPWRWNNSDWATASLVAGVTGVFFWWMMKSKASFKIIEALPPMTCRTCLNRLATELIPSPPWSDFIFMAGLGRMRKWNAPLCWPLKVFLSPDCSPRL